jgi:hypothetical protein
MSLVLPASMAAVLAWGFLAPDDQVAAGSPHQVRRGQGAAAAVGGARGAGRGPGFVPSFCWPGP